MLWGFDSFSVFIYCFDFLCIIENQVYKSTMESII